MMNYHAEDEILLEIKHFFVKYKKILSVLLFSSLLIAGSVIYWQRTATTYNQQASDIYNKIISYTTANKNNTDKVAKLTSELQQQYHKTAYATLATFVHAKQAIQNYDYNTAKSQLKWIIDNNKDEALVIIAKQRFARILIAESPENAAEALAMIENIVTNDNFASANFMLIGDIYYRNNDIEKANQAYRKSYDLLKQNNQQNILLDRKIANSTIATNN